MSAQDRFLPPGFDALEEYADWALPTEAERNARRLQSTLPEIQRFYDAMHEQFPHVLQILSGRSIASLDDQEHHLTWLAKSLMEVSGCIELFSAVAVPKAVPAERLGILQ